jgi:hypothetical protein
MLLLLLLAVVVVAAAVVVDIVVDLPTEIVAPRVVVVVLSIRLVFDRRSSIQQRLHTRFNIEKTQKSPKHFAIVTFAIKLNTLVSSSIGARC